MIRFLSFLFFIAGFIGINMGYFGGPFSLFHLYNPTHFIAGITFIVAGGIIWALADIKSTIDQQNIKNDNS